MNIRYGTPGKEKFNVEMKRAAVVVTLRLTDMVAPAGARQVELRKLALVGAMVMRFARGMIVMILLHSFSLLTARNGETDRITGLMVVVGHNSQSQQ